MKTRIHLHRTVRCGVLLLALLGGGFLAPTARTQPAATTNVDNRLLLVFNTSSDMKRRLPAVRIALETLLATSLEGQLHAGDTVGVWTLDQELHTGQFPLQRWDPADAAMIVSNISNFISKQRFRKTTDFDALVPLMTQLVQGSERLTVVLFCDGNGTMRGTPYDAGVNQVFQQNRKEREKSRAPIILVFRAQLGQYVGCAASFPPQSLNLPVFPPLPPPPAPPAPAKAVAAPAPRPATPVPPLIIIGPKPGASASVPPAGPPPAKPPAAVSNNVPAVPPAAMAPAAIATNSSAQPVAEESHPPLAATEVATNPPAEVAAMTHLPSTNALAAPVADVEARSNTGLIIGGGLLVLAGGLLIFTWHHFHGAARGSLISGAMNADKKTPPT